jgi:formate hydrogenlyase subunit 3/multisubunit Na+/H+ antiporter MnhD subunit
MNPDIVLLLVGVGALLATAVLGMALGARASGRRLVYGSALLVCAAMAAIALRHLLDPAATPSTAWLPLGLPWQGAHFRLDALSSFFAFVTGLGGAAASLFALGYGRHVQSPQRVLPFSPLFLAGMNLVVLADVAFTFLLSWEFMSLSSWALVMAHHQDRDNARAGYVYLIMASFGTLALLLAFGLLATGGDYTFDAMRASVHTPATAFLILALVLLGAGSKAGVVPLHAWLPLAHPAAPSHVSALMSGVMTKVAVYGFIRIVFELLGSPQWWSGSSCCWSAAQRLCSASSMR